MSRILFSSSVLALLLSFGVVSPAYAIEETGPWHGSDPNIIRMMNIPNFRRAAVDDKYQYSKRRIQQFDEFTTATGSTTTFDRRAAYLRATQIRRIQEDLNNRVFGDTRERPYYLPTQGQSRFLNTIQRRLDQSSGSIRTRSQARAVSRMNLLSPAEKQQQIIERRAQVKESERNRLSPTYTNVLDCYELARRRQAQCLYEQRVDR